VLCDEQLHARNFLVDVPVAGSADSLACPGVPYRFSSGTGRSVKPAPRIGESNRETFNGTLGLSDDELERLSSLNVI
jgi:crotonobetainyl-CoA:carnitine CoA-transferase CaiB-like acyl-CoA transferase